MDWIQLKIGLDFLVFTKHKNKQVLTTLTKLSVLSLNKVGRTFVFIIIFFCRN